VATNLVNIAFDEGADIQIDTIEAIRGGVSSVTVTALDIREYGVVVQYPNGDSPPTALFTTLVPYANIKSISQVESI